MQLGQTPLETKNRFFPLQNALDDVLDKNIKK